MKPPKKKKKRIMSARIQPVRPVSARVAKSNSSKWTNKYDQENIQVSESVRIAYMKKLLEPKHPAGEMKF